MIPTGIDEEENERKAPSSTIPGSKGLWAIAFAIAFLPSFLYFITTEFPPTHDGEVYWNLGSQLAETGFFGADGVPEGYTPPGYPFIVSVFIRVFGATWYPITVFHLLLAVPTILLTGVLAATLYGRNAGLCAMVVCGWLYDIYSMPPRMLTENVFTPMFLGFAVLLAVGGRNSRWWRFAAAGLLMGLATLIRGTTVLLVPFLIVSLAIWPWWKAGPKWRVGKWLLLTFLCFMIPVGAWTYRNYRAFGFAFPISLNSGDNLALGNNRFGTFWYLAPDSPLRERLGIAPGDPVAVYRNGREEFLREFRERPVMSTLRSFPRLWYYMTDQWPWFANPKFLEIEEQTPEGLERHSMDWIVPDSLIRWQWTLVMMAGFFALLVGRHTNTPQRLLLLGICAYWTGFHAIIQMHPRYKIPLEPFFAIYAGFFCAYVVPRLAAFRALAMQPVDTDE